MPDSPPVRPAGQILLPPADQALAEVIDLLLAAGFRFTIPAWDGDAYLKINNARRAITDLTITKVGNVTWEYRSVQCPHLHPSRLLGMAIELLDPDHTRRAPSLGENAGFPLVEIIRYALYRYGFTATIDETNSDTGPVLTATNPDQPYRGTLDISDDGELSWYIRAPHHPHGGIPLPDIAATINRALATAQYPPAHPHPRIRHSRRLASTVNWPALVLAEGHSLLPMMKLRLAAPEVLIDIIRAGLSGISVAGDELVIGATARHARRRRLRPDQDRRSAAGPLRRWSATLRSGTAARSAARSRTRTRPPTCRWPWSRSTARSNSAARTARGSCWPTISSPATSRPRSRTANCSPPSGCRAADDPWGYQKFVRRANDWAIIGVAAAGGRVALANMASTPIHATATEQALATGADPAQAAEYAAEGTSSAADIHADAEYRRHLARVLTERALSGQRS